jgi:hypothetical protein
MIKRKKLATVSAREWNEFLEDVRAGRVLHALDLRGGRQWRHPWATVVEWDDAAAQWVARVKAGFCNGLPATVLREVDGVPVDVALTERADPLPVVPLPVWRAIGADASPDVARVSEDGGLQTSYEPVPEYFTDLGVAAAPVIAGSLESGLVEQLAVQDRGQAQRRLRAVDLVLYHDRPALTTAAAAGNALTASTRVRSNARAGAYLRAVAKYAREAEPDPVQQLLGNWADGDRDSVQIATVYLLSPAGAGEDVDETWEPFVRYAQFWNLSYAHTQQRLAGSPQPLTVQTGLAAGAGDRVIQQLLQEGNQALQAALAQLGTERIVGRFWSV